MEHLNVEIVLKNYDSRESQDLLIAQCGKFLHNGKFHTGTVISKFECNEKTKVSKNVEYIIICEHKDMQTDYIDFSAVSINWFVYTLDKIGRQLEREYDDEGDAIQLATVQVLPSAEYVGLWENLIYDISIKDELLQFANTSLLLSEKKTNSTIINYNKLVLLHGPPGTGKTSLCKALAQKLTVRLQNRYKKGFLLEVNSHSLFSKWFSESGKLVKKMFEKVEQIAQEPDVIVFLLVDEVESLANDRLQSAGTEPSDAIRVVNALLTEIDRMKSFSNVLILATSNIESCIDSAFVNRVNIRQYIGLPGTNAIYQIYHSCIQELMRVGIIVPNVVIPSITVYQMLQGCEAIDIGQRLMEICKLSAGFSGRTLRKLPFIAVSYSKKKSQSICMFLDRLLKAVEKEHNSEKYFGKKLKILN